MAKGKRRIGARAAMNAFMKMPLASRIRDRQRKARLNTGKGYLSNPKKYDYPGVDTPSWWNRKHGYTRRVPKKGRLKGWKRSKFAMYFAKSGKRSGKGYRRTYKKKGKLSAAGKARLRAAALARPRVGGRFAKAGLNAGLFAGYQGLM